MTEINKPNDIISHSKLSFDLGITKKTAFVVSYLIKIQNQIYANHYSCSELSFGQLIDLSKNLIIKRRSRKMKKSYNYLSSTESIRGRLCDKELIEYSIDLEISGVEDLINHKEWELTSNERVFIRELCCIDEEADSWETTSIETDQYEESIKVPDSPAVNLRRLRASLSELAKKQDVIVKSEHSRIMRKIRESEKNKPNITFTRKIRNDGIVARKDDKEEKSDKTKNTNLVPLRDLESSQEGDSKQFITDKCELNLISQTKTVIKGSTGDELEKKTLIHFDESRMCFTESMEYCYAHNEGFVNRVSTHEYSIRTHAFWSSIFVFPEFTCSWNIVFDSSSEVITKVWSNLGIILGQTTNKMMFSFEN